MSEAKQQARVLVVDDEERNRRLLGAMLEADGYQVSEAADGEQALALARQSPHDLILLDVMMPGLDGYEVARVLKAEAATKAIPVVMGSAIAGGHHERWDGGGYPLGLKGEAIPLSARIMNICDQYDALRSQRPYKPAFSHEKTLEIITVGDGRTLPAHFDPDVLAAFNGCVGRFRDIFEAHRDEG